MAHQAFDKLDGRQHRGLADWLHFRPLGEFVDGDVEVLVSSGSTGERSQDVHSPDRKGP